MQMACLPTGDVDSSYGEDSDKEGELSGVDTPKRTRQPKPSIVGSSSTWNEDELDLFKVQLQGDVDVKDMIPENGFTL
jgi:hypothetical protein